MAALISAIHRCAQEHLPFSLVGAVLPQLRGRMGNAKSYAERLFDLPEIGPLNPEDARDAIRRPAESEGVSVEDGAIKLIIDKRQGYPYFLQEWEKHTWDVAQSSPIRLDDVVDASDEAVAALDESFSSSFRPPYSGREKVYTGDGWIRARTSSLRGHRRATWQSRELTWPDTRGSDHEGNDLEPDPRLYGVYGSAFR